MWRRLRYPGWGNPWLGLPRALECQPLVSGFFPSPWSSFSALSPLSFYPARSKVLPLPFCPQCQAAGGMSELVGVSDPWDSKSADLCQELWLTAYISHAKPPPSSCSQPHALPCCCPCSQQPHVALGSTLDPGGKLKSRKMMSRAQDHTTKEWQKQIQTQAQRFNSRVCDLNRHSQSPHHSPKGRRGPGPAEELLGGEGKLRQGAGRSCGVAGGRWWHRLTEHVVNS